ncbi:prolactin-releasing peptide receptor-like [Rhincodon typus]|uniref:prolactin-releasing peptide receptor-like n=1 Tax=Rhincodon typus TaxID=259920 RepID=UPI002030E686|nr:prolactin-releasing peptide receptor-like [Rhincodon typus]
MTKLQELRPSSSLISGGSRERVRGDCWEANLSAFVILSRGKCGLSTCTTHYLVAMSVTDLLVVITEVILRRINNYYFPLNVLKLTSVCRPLYVMIRAAIDCSVWFTVTFTFDRFVAISCQKLKLKYCTKKTSTVVLAITSILLCLKNIPIYFRYKPKWVINNVEWRCSNQQNYFRDPRWTGFRIFEKVLTPLLPFGLILLLNAMTIRHILMAIRVRKGLKGQKKDEKRSDQEMESRRKSMILLFTISGTFILLWLVYIIYIFDFDDSVIDPRGMFEVIAYMLRNLSCCTNTFIYVATQSKFRDQLKRMLKYPLTSIHKFMNSQNN